MHLQSDVCIVGDGAIGKAAALGFAQAGLKVSLLCAPSSAPKANVAQTDAKRSAAAVASWDIRVYALNHVSQDLLATLKVWDAMDAARIAPVDAMLVKGGRGDQGGSAGSLEFDSYGARVGALAWIVEDRNLNHALDAAIKFAPNLQLVHTRASRLQVNAAAARIDLENGDTLASSLVIGADGGQSWVRGQCDIGIDFRSYEQRAVVSNFETEKPHHGVAHQWFTASEGIVALLPLPGQRVSLVWSAPEALADTLLRESLPELAARLTELSGHALGRLTPLQPDAIGAFPLSLLRTHAITAPRVALAGDAAHVIHPLAGHGMNLGFADVASLLKTVTEREAYRDCGDERVLARYARARKEDIFLMQLATDGMQRLFGVDFEPLRQIRNLGLNLVNNLPVLKRRLITHALGKRSPNR
ncbi:UbiH/UbiF family hydroxylase [soil metagenome]